MFLLILTRFELPRVLIKKSVYYANIGNFGYVDNNAAYRSHAGHFVAGI